MIIPSRKELAGAEWAKGLRKELKKLGHWVPEDLEPIMFERAFLAASAYCGGHRMLQDLEGQVPCWPRFRYHTCEYFKNAVDTEDGWHEAYSLPGRGLWPETPWLVCLRWAEAKWPRRRKPKPATSKWPVVTNVFDRQPTCDFLVPESQLLGSIHNTFDRCLGTYCTYSKAHKMLLNNGAKFGMGVPLRTLVHLRKYISEEEHKLTFVDGPVSDCGAQFVDTPAMRFESTHFQMAFLKPEHFPQEEGKLLSEQLDA